MAESRSPAGFPGGKHARFLSLVLLVQIAGFWAVSRRELVPLARPLSDFPRQIGTWRMVQEGVVDPEITEVLKADDILTRTYAGPSGGANLFIAYFKSQRSGQMPHSPKNCLPGSGWMPSESEIIPVQVPGMSAPILVNRYVVAKGDDKSVVLYWYQAHNRVIASEYRARFYLVADAIRYNRTDTALVRVVVPVRNRDSAQATSVAESFVRAFFMPLKGHLPS